jgi:hypothetical protein
MPILAAMQDQECHQSVQDTVGHPHHDWCPNLPCARLVVGRVRHAGLPPLPRLQVMVEATGEEVQRAHRQREPW